MHVQNELEILAAAFTLVKSFAESVRLSRRLIRAASAQSYFFHLP